MTDQSIRENEESGLLLKIVSYIFIPWTVLVLAYFSYHHWEFIKNWPNLVLYCWLDLFIDKPELAGPGFFIRLLENLRNIFVLTLITLAAFGAGNGIIRKFKGLQAGKLELYLYSVTLGMGLLAYTAQLLGLFHILYTPLLWIILVLIVCISYQSYISLYDGLKGWWTRIREKKSIGLNPVLMLMSILIGLLWLLGGLAPPFDYDSLHYHLAFPQIYLHNHAITFQPQNVFAQFPFNGEMLYVWGMGLGGYVLPAMLHAVSGLITAAFVYSIGNRLWGRTAGAAAALICMTSLHLSRAAIKPQIDIFAALFAIAALGCIFRWISGKERSWLLFSGIFTGLALGTKYTALLLVLVPLAIGVICSSFKERKGRPYIFGNVMIFGGTALLVVLPWYIRNLVWTGNPFYPLAYGIFGGRGMNADLDKMIFSFHSSPLLKDLAGTGGGEAIWAAVWSDLAEIWRVPVTALKYNVIWLSPALFIFAPFGILCGKESRKYILWTVIFILYYYIAWFAVTHHVIRFLFPVIPLLALLGGKSLNTLHVTRPVFRFGVAILVIITVFQTGSFFSMVSASDSWTYISGKSDRDGFLSRRLPDYYPMVKFINNNVPGHEKILQIGELRTTYQEHPGITANIFNRSPVDDIMLNSGSADEVIGKLRAAGYSRVWINRAEYNRLAETYKYGSAWDRRVLESALAELEVSHATPFGELYMINP
jgi:4-amino-4-deoxy-L-arabinose transferase-like glycosyltransferase